MAGIGSAISRGVSSGASGGGSTGSWWDPIINIGAQVLGGVAGATIANQGANAQADATREASAQSVALNRDIFNTNLALSKPFYQGSGNAFNMLSRIYGMPTQNFSWPANGSNVSTSGTPLSWNLGAGQPVAGHSNVNGTGSILTSGLGSAAGYMIGGPVGGIIGGTLGALVRPSGDNWQTVATQAPAGYNYDAYMKGSGLDAEWAKPDVQALFNGNRDAYAYWHANGGVLNGKQSWAPAMNYLQELTDKVPMPGSDKTTLPVGSAQQETATGTGGGTSNAFMSEDPLQLFWNSPHGQLAKNQFLTIDNPAIKGAYATQGKAVSGAQQKALADRGAALGGNAFGNYVSGISQMAGLGPTVTSQAQSSGNAFANNAGTAIQNAGIAAGNASATRNNNWANAFNNVAAGAYQYGKDANWF